MKEDKKKQEGRVILAKLQLLANIRKQHEWVVGQKEVDNEEKAEAKIDSEAPDSTPNKSKGE